MSDDLISRQAAIDAAIEAVDEWDGGYNLRRADMIADAINNSVPSAQPQLEECPIYGGMCGYPSNLCYECPRHEGAKEQPQWWTEGLQPFAQPKWIPVTDRLPEDSDYHDLWETPDGAVLWCKETGEIGIGWYYASTKNWCDLWDNSVRDVVAWMPLPEPYAERREDA